MASTTVRIEGLQALGERMRKLALEMNTKIARDATNAAAQVIKKQAIANAPEYFEAHKLEGVVVQPGNLKKNIVVKRVAPGRAAPLTSQHIVTVRGKRKDGYAARYGRLVEFGTVKMSANPYLRSAFEQEKGFAVQAMIDKLKSGIDKAIQG